MKKWYESRTHWFNIAIAIIGFLELNLRLVKDNLGDNYGYVFIAVSIVGIVLRNSTTKAIETKTAKEPEPDLKNVRL